MIRFSMEIPTAKLAEWSPLCDQDFALAHKVLEDKTYADFFASRHPGRTLILDNSMHELGHPLPVSDLVHAAKLCDADIVVAPDKLDEYEQNLVWYRETREAFADSSTGVGAVLCGETREARKYYLLAISGAAMLLLPYRRPRLLWYLEHSRLIHTFFSRIHLLGVSDRADLDAFAAAANPASNACNWSVDTAKPVKHGMSLLNMEMMDVWRGSTLHSKDLLDLVKVSPEQDAAVIRNVSFLRSLCR